MTESSRIVLPSPAGRVGVAALALVVGATMVLGSVAMGAPAAAAAPAAPAIRVALATPAPVTPVAATVAGPGGPHLMLKIPAGPERDSAPAGAHLNYYGGRVISNVKVQDVFWDAAGNYGAGGGPASTLMPNFFSAVTNSPYFDWLTEYDTGGTNQVIGRGSFGGQTTITPSPANDGSTIDDSNIQAELGSELATGRLPAPSLDAQGNVNSVYALYFPDSKTLTSEGATGGVSWCAYHGTISYSGLSVPYMVLPAFTAGSGYAGGCGANPTLFNNFTSVSSHELLESVTDTEVGLATVVGAPLAWYDPVYGEAGDICDHQQGTIAGYVVQQVFSDVANDCIVSRAVANDFSISVSPASTTLTRGLATRTTVQTAVTSGTAESVQLSASGLPAGVSASFSPPAVAAGGRSVLTLTASSAAAVGTLPVTVSGTTPSTSHGASFSVTVAAAPVFEDLGCCLAPGSGPAVSSWATGRLDVIIRGTDNQLWHKSFSGAWSSYEPLGGATLDNPAVVSWAPGRLDVFVRGTDNQLWHKWYAGTWSGWEALGGSLTSAPTVSSWGPGRLDVFARGSGNQLVHKWFSGGWSGWETLGGSLTSAPSAAAWGAARIDVVVQGTDSGVWHKWYQGGWSGWETLAGTVAGTPQVSTWGPGHLELFARDLGGNGLDHKSYDEGWSSWTNEGGGMSGPPAAVSWAAGRTDVFANGQTGQNGVTGDLMHFWTSAGPGAAA